MFPLSETTSRRGFLKRAGQAGSAALVGFSSSGLAANKKQVRPDRYSTSIRKEGTSYSFSWLHPWRKGSWRRRGQLISVTFTPGNGFPAEQYYEEEFRKRRMIGTKANLVHLAEVDTDPYYDSFICPLVDQITYKAQRIGEDPVWVFLSFVQGFGYVTTDYQKFASEAILQTDGDCSDSSLAFATLVNCYHGKAVRNRKLKKAPPLWGYLFNKKERHVAVGVRNHGQTPRYKGTNWDGYYSCETTGTDYAIGEKTLERASLRLPRPFG